MVLCSLMRVALRLLFPIMSIMLLSYSTTVSAVAVSDERRAFFTSGGHVPKPVDHPLVQDAAQFAIGELQKLSDSGIYTTLQLAEIQSAAAEVGDFHYAVHLHLALASPHFQSGNATENYELLVMESKDLPGRRQKTERSIAIDEFPVMDEDAIEEFWIRMVDKRRRKRTALFDQWRREADEGTDPVVAAAAEIVMEARGIPPPQPIKISTASRALPATAAPAAAVAPDKPKKKKTLSLEDLDAMPTKQLRKMLASQTGVSSELRAAIVTIIDERLDQLERHESAAKDEL